MPKSIDFSKVAVFTDLHYGMKNNSKEHNDDCENFIKWMIEQSEAEGIKTCIFGGDFHHVRSSINVSTLNYSVRGLRLLSSYFDNVIFLIGNHDLFYRDKYEIHSIPYITQFPNIQLIEEIKEMDGVAFVPWLISDQWKKVPGVKSPYMFGHFELPKFKMNAMIEMPDHGLLNSGHFVNQKQVFSGHFHKRQNSGKIWYIGNAFPHNYADAWDDDRGMMVWTPGNTPVFKKWPGAPRYRTATMSQLLTDPERIINNSTFAKITVDIPASFEDVNFVKELLAKNLNAREVQIIVPSSMDDQDQMDEADINFESVDTIVISHLKNIDSTSIDKNKLIEIYQNL